MADLGIQGSVNADRAGHEYLFSVGRPVTQIFNLLYRRFAIGWTFGMGRWLGFGARSRIQFCHTADCKSALPPRRLHALNICKPERQTLNGRRAVTSSFLWW